MNILEKFILYFKLSSLLHKISNKHDSLSYVFEGIDGVYLLNDPIDEDTNLIMKRTRDRKTSSRVSSRNVKSSSEVRPSRSRDDRENNDVKTSEMKPSRSHSNNRKNAEDIDIKKTLRYMRERDSEKDFIRERDRKRSLNLSSDKQDYLKKDDFNIAKEIRESKDSREKEKSSLGQPVKKHNQNMYSIKELIEKNKQNRKQQADRIHNVKNLNDEEIGSYLKALSAQVEGKGIVNSQLKAVGIMIFVLIVIMFAIGTFLNKNNPIIPLITSINKSLSIKILDNRNVRVFEVKREGSTLTTANNISKNLENTFISLHAVNELIFQKRNQISKEKDIAIDDVKVNQIFINSILAEYNSYINSPREDFLRINTTALATILDIVMLLPNLVMDKVHTLLNPENNNSIEQFMVSEFGVEDIPLNPDGTVDVNFAQNYAPVTDIKNKNGFYLVNGCKIFQIPQDVGNPDCEFSSVNIIMTKLYNRDTSSIFSDYINPIKDYLLTNWLKEKVTLTDFFLLFFNITYYGNYQVGMRASFNQYFDKVLIDEMDVPHALYMIKHLYDDNKNYYPDYDITAENILDMMIYHGYVPQDKKYIILARLDQISKSAKRPRTSFAIYIDEIFMAGYKLFPEFYNINVTTTFSNSFQNMITGMLVDKMKRFNIPASSALIIKDNGIVAGVTIKLIDGRSHYQNEFPMVYAYNSIKPFLYLSLLNAKSDAPTGLLSSNYQNLIFANKRIDQFVPPYFNPNLSDIVPSQPKMTPEEIELLENKDLSLVPNGLKKNLAIKLTNLENDFFSETDFNSYLSTFHKLGIKISEKTKLEDLLEGNVRISMSEIAKAYSIFKNNGDMIDPKFISSINEKQYDEYNSSKVLSVRKTYTNLLKDVFFNVIRSSNGKEFYLIMDFQSAVLFNDEYLVSLWLGDLEPNEDKKDTSEAMEILVKQIVSQLQ